MQITQVATSAAVELPRFGWEGSVLGAARSGDPATQGAALRRIDEVTEAGFEATGKYIEKAF